MNLLLINYEYPPIGGGAANATWHLARELTATGHRVTVLTAAFQGLNGWRDEYGVNVFRCRSARKQQGTSTILEMLAHIVSAGVSLPSIVRHAKIDAIIVFFLFPGGPIGLLAYLLFRIPYLVALRGGDVPGADPRLLWMHALLAPVRKLIYRTSAGIVANSAGLKVIAQHSDWVDIQVIPNGVDTDSFQPAALRHYGNNAVFQLLYAGRFQPEKNLSFLFHELAKLSDCMRSSLTIHMVGEGPQKDDLEEIAKKSGFSDRVTWHGWLDRAQMQAMYRRVDGLVMPSRYEGMSNVILEAMASGLPVLASRVGGNIDLIQDGQTGYLFDLDSSRSFQDAFAKMVEKPDKSRKIGMLARQFVLGHLSWAQVANRYLEGFSKKIGGIIGFH